MEAMFEEHSLNRDLMEEVKRLRAENEELKRNY